MPPPYTKKKCNVLHELVERNKPPLDKWPKYSIKIIENTGKEISTKIDVDKRNKKV